MTQLSFLDPKLQQHIQYDEANPDLYKAFVRLAKQAIAARCQHAGANRIIEVMRWETSLAASGDDYKINNNIAPYYSRKFEAEYPEHKGFFRMRKSPEIKVYGDE